MVRYSSILGSTGGGAMSKVAGLVGLFLVTNWFLDHSAFGVIFAAVAPMQLRIYPLRHLC